MTPGQQEPDVPMSACEAVNRHEAALREDSERREQRKAERRGAKRSKPVPPRAPQRGAPLGRSTTAQRDRIGDLACVHCGKHAGACHPAHLIPRAVTSQEAADDPRMTIALCPPCHREYDSGLIDLSGDLEPRWRDSVECAVGAVGLWTALRYITGPKTLAEIAEKALAA
jgi:hypothetical protein